MSEEKNNKEENESLIESYEQKKQAHRQKRANKKRKAKEGQYESTRAKKVSFLEVYSRSGNKREAAKATGVSLRQHYYWMDRDPEYAEAFQMAKEEATEVLEREAFRRGVEGWEEPVFYRGEEVGKITRYSDQLLVVLLKGNKPEKYKDRVEHTGESKSYMNIDLKNLSEEELNLLEGIIDKTSKDDESEGTEDEGQVGEVPEE